MLRTAPKPLWTHWKPSSQAHLLRNSCRTDYSLTTGTLAYCQLCNSLHVTWFKHFEIKCVVCSFIFTENWFQSTLSPVKMYFTGELCVSSSRLKEMKVMKCWSKCYQMLPLTPTTSMGERTDRDAASCIFLQSASCIRLNKWWDICHNDNVATPGIWSHVRFSQRSTFCM